MATNRDPEIATTCGSLDDSAFSEAFPLTSFAGRQLARNANRLLTKGEHWHSLLWKSKENANTTYLTIGRGVNQQIGRVTSWTKITPTFTQKKMPGIRTATAKCVLSSTSAYFLSVTTSQSPDPQTNSVTVSTTGGAETEVTISNVPVSPGAEEEITYWIKGKPGAGAQSDYGLGANQYSLIVYVDNNRIKVASTTLITDATAQDYATSRVVNYATAGTYICILESTSTSSARVCADYHDVLAVLDGSTIAVSPAGAQWQFSLAVARYAHFFKCPIINVKSLCMAGDARSDY